MNEAALTLLTLAAVVVLFASSVVPVEIVAVGSALVLLAFGIISLPEALAGFADPAVILIGALFVVSEGLDATGVTTWVGQVVANRAGSGARRLLLFTMLLSAGLTALIGLNGAVAALLPMTIVMAMRRSMEPSRLLMPLAFAGSAGSLLLLIGSPVNVVISDAAENAGVGSFGFAEFALVGIPVVVGTLLIVLFFGPRLIPERISDALPPDLSGHASTLVQHYSLENVTRQRVAAHSDLIGLPRLGVDLMAYPGISLILVTDDAGRPTSDGLIDVGDVITVVGESTTPRFAETHGLDVEEVRSGSQVDPVAPVARGRRRRGDHSAAVGLRRGGR